MIELEQRCERSGKERNRRQSTSFGRGMSVRFLRKVAEHLESASKGINHESLRIGDRFLLHSFRNRGRGGTRTSATDKICKINAFSLSLLHLDRATYLTGAFF